MRRTKLKLKGIMLVTTIVTIAAWILLSGGIFFLQSNYFQGFATRTFRAQARSFACTDAELLSAVRYDDLEGDDAFTKVNLHKGRAAIGYGNSDGWEDELVVGAEQSLGDSSEEWKYRIVTINIYRQGDTIPRYTLAKPFVRQAEGYTKEEVDKLIKKIQEE